MKHLEFFKKGGFILHKGEIKTINKDKHIVHLKPDGLQHFKNLNLKDSPPQIKKKSIKPLSYKF